MSGIQQSAATRRDVAIETCDVCIVGAGIAGLNALFVASRYLSRDQKVILIDRRARVGGMWVDTYPYVRLHQPHPMFTAGNIKWTLGKEHSYLATKGEVLASYLPLFTAMRPEGMSGRHGAASTASAPSAQRHSRVQACRPIASTSQS